MEPRSGGQNQSDQNLDTLFKGARSRYFRLLCLILLIRGSNRQIRRARFFHLPNHGHKTAENDFLAV